MTPAKYAMFAIVIRSMRTVANAMERWLETEPVDERVPPRSKGAADCASSAPVMHDTSVSPVNQREHQHG